MKIFVVFVMLLRWNNLFAFTQIITDSYSKMEEVCNSTSKILIVIDLLDVGIEYNSPCLRAENRRILNIVLKEKLKVNFKIRDYMKSMEKEGLSEISEFLEVYKKLGGDVLLITDQFYYRSCEIFLSLDLKYDSYKNGVLFYRGNFWLKVIKDLAEKYDCIIFISSNRNKIKNFLNEDIVSESIAILFLNKREPWSKEKISGSLID